MSDLVDRWSCDEPVRDANKCRNPHGCHCREITAAATALTAKDKEIEALREQAKKYQSTCDTYTQALQDALARADTAEQRVKELQRSYDLAIGARLEWRRQAEIAERERDEARAALKAIFAAEDEFRAQLPEKWEGDPLADAITAAHAVIKQGE